MKYLSILLIVVLASCQPQFEEVEYSNTPVSGGHVEESEKQKVIEEKVVVERVYVNKEDYAYYSPEGQGEVSYWYIHYKYDGGSGFTMMKLNTSYPDIWKMINNIKEWNKKTIDSDDYVGLTFFERVPFETYKAYKQ